MNRLEALCRPLIDLVCEYRCFSKAGAPVAAETMRSDIRRALDDIRGRCEGDPVLRREFTRIERPLVFFIDYTIKEGAFPRMARACARLQRAFRRREILRSAERKSRRPRSGGQLGRFLSADGARVRRQLPRKRRIRRAAHEALRRAFPERFRRSRRCAFRGRGKRRRPASRRPQPQTGRAARACGCFRRLRVLLQFLCVSERDGGIPRCARFGGRGGAPGVCFFRGRLCGKCRSFRRR